MLARNPLNYYIAGSLMYGCIRKFDDLVNAKVKVPRYRLNEEWDMVKSKPKMVPMLYIDRMKVLAISTAASPFLLPYYLHHDLSCLEMKLRKADPNDYHRIDARVHWIDYLF